MRDYPAFARASKYYVLQSNRVQRVIENPPRGSEGLREGRDTGALSSDRVDDSK